MIMRAVARGIAYMVAATCSGINNVSSQPKCDSYATDVQYSMGSRVVRS